MEIFTASRHFLGWPVIKRAPGSCYIYWAALELSDLLLPPPVFWNYRLVPSHHGPCELLGFNVKPLVSRGEEACNVLLQAQLNFPYLDRLMVLMAEVLGQGGVVLA